jgi:restriction system protein
MTIPDFQTIMRPAMALLADGEARRSRDVKIALADDFQLTELS